MIFLALQYRTIKYTLQITTLAKIIATYHQLQVFLIHFILYNVCTFAYQSEFYAQNTDIRIKNTTNHLILQYLH